MRARAARRRRRRLRRPGRAAAGLGARRRSRRSRLRECGAAGVRAHRDMSDPGVGEILREYFETVAAEMNAVLDRTTLSAVFNEAHDCSAGVFVLGEDGVSLIARAQAEPVHIYASLYSVEGLVAYHG